MDYYRLTDKDTPVLEPDMRVWWDWFCHAPEDWKIVKSSPIGKNVNVVTLYGGKDDAMHEPEDPPWLWRTELRDGDSCEVIYRYRTRAQAERNHDLAVRDIPYWRGERELVRHERRNRTLFGRVRRVLKGLHR